MQRNSCFAEGKDTQSLEAQLLCKRFAYIDGELASFNDYISGLKDKAEGLNEHVSPKKMMSYYDCESRNELQKKYKAFCDNALKHKTTELFDSAVHVKNIILLCSNYTNMAKQCVPQIVVELDALHSALGEEVQSYKEELLEKKKESAIRPQRDTRCVIM